MLAMEYINNAIENKQIRQVFLITPREHRIITDLSFQKGLGSKGMSAALRMIINEWAEMRKLYARIPVIGTVDPETGKISVNKE
jgi:hypothetical protein